MRLHFGKGTDVVMITSIQGGLLMLYLLNVALGHTFIFSEIPLILPYKMSVIF